MIITFFDNWKKFDNKSFENYFLEERNLESPLKVIYRSLLPQISSLDPLAKNCSGLVPGMYSVFIELQFKEKIGRCCLINYSVRMEGINSWYFIYLSLKHLRNLISQFSEKLMLISNWGAFWLSIWEWGRVAGWWWYVQLFSLNAWILNLICLTCKLFFTLLLLVLLGIFQIIKRNFELSTKKKKKTIPKFQPWSFL